MYKSLFICSLCLMTIVAVSTFSLSAQSNIEPKKYSIDNCVKAFDTTKVDSTKAGYAYWFIKKGFAQSALNVKMSYVDRATETHPPHSHANEEYFYILEGNAIVSVAGRETVVGANTIIYCPGGVPHGIRRAGDNPIRYLVVNN